ncbi:MAG: hypothetical protein WBE26_01545, partial [Phycisphaerae bacterium]
MPRRVPVGREPAIPEAPGRLYNPAAAGLRAAARPDGIGCGRRLSKLTRSSLMKVALKFALWIT